MLPRRHPVRQLTCRLKSSRTCSWNGYRYLCAAVSSILMPHFVVWPCALQTRAGRVGLYSIGLTAGCGISPSAHIRPSSQLRHDAKPSLLLERVRQGVDPADEKRARRNLPWPEIETFGAVVQDYLERHVRKNCAAVTYTEAKRDLECNETPKVAQPSSRQRHPTGRDRAGRCQALFILGPLPLSVRSSPSSLKKYTPLLGQFRRPEQSASNRAPSVLFSSTASSE
jgi:hypothetical protein